jgi:HD-GYP domain-containing protein (c-di-GMP phosphodiesterase class II)
MNIDDHIRQLATAGEQPQNAQSALRDFLTAAHRVDTDPGEARRINDLAEEADVDIAAYDQGLAALERGDTDTAQALLLQAASNDLDDPDGLLADLLKGHPSQAGSLSLLGRAAQARAHRAILNAAYRNAPFEPTRRSGLKRWRFRRGPHITGADLEHVLLAAMESKDPYTRRHLERISRLVTLLGQQLGLPSAQLEAVRVGGLFHDIGKLAIPDTVLRKSGALTEEEFTLIQLHTLRGARIVQELPEFFAQAAGHARKLIAQETMAGILHHHEKYNGRGYPFGLAGEDIPEVSRVIAVVDSFDTMTSQRSYRAARSAQEAIHELRRCAGTNFDPRMVEAFVSVYDAHSDQIDDLIRTEAVTNQAQPAEQSTPHDHHFLSRP